MNREFAIILLLALFSFFANLGGPSIYILDEAKNAGCAMEMYQRNDWVVPTFNAVLRTDKPPLHYYFMRIAYSAWGITPFAARFFSALMGVVMLIGVYVFVKRSIDTKTAWYACIILITSVQTVIQFHLAVPDPFLITFLTLSLLLMAEGFKSGHTGKLMSSYGCVALATLAKGPVAILFYSIITIVFLFAQRSFSWKTLMDIKAPWGALLFLGIVLPWYIAVGIETGGEWLHQFIFKHNIDRFTTTMEGHGGFPGAAILILISALMPFSFYFPQMVKQVWKEKNTKPVLMLSLIAVAVVTVFFLFSRTILPGYIGPALPFFAILLGYFWRTVANKKPGTGMLVSGYVFLLVTVAIVAGLISAQKNDPVLQTINLAWVYFLPIPTGAVIALFYIYRKRMAFAFAAYGISFFIFIQIFFYGLFPKIDILNPVSQGMPLLHSAKAIAYYENINPAFVFENEAPVKKLYNSAELAAFLQKPGARVISNVKSLAGIDTTIYHTLFRKQDLFERPVTVIIEGRH